MFVDTAPVMEKPLAQAAGLGWQGKHTVLVSRDLRQLAVPRRDLHDRRPAGRRAEADHCGSCRRCLDVCPTAAFPAPYQLDARRCISYLTIEHKGPIPAALRPLMGNRIFGCDDCLAVCPWNKFAARRPRGEARGARRISSRRRSPSSRAWTTPAFRARFSGAPIKRTGRDRFVRNVLIAIGNSGDAALADEAVRLLDDASPLVRGAAIWALGAIAARRRGGVARRRARAGRDGR